jgi:uncharacterized protein (DUF1810 family)
MVSDTSGQRLGRFDLERFVAAQKTVYAEVLRELRAAHKQSHWMWFVFPQLAGLGSSPMAQRYALSGTAEAAAYLADPLLGPRLRECTRLVLAAPPGSSANRIFGYPDDLKFRSSMTLFREAAPEEPLFREALERFYAGGPDGATLRLLGR